MCGRYTLFTDDEYQDIREIIRKVQEQGREVKTGEIFPTNSAPVLLNKGEGVLPEAMKWGWPKFTGSGVLVNARSETAEEKNMFRKSLYTRRCVVPTTGFYEWDKAKAKYRFILPQTNTLYLAGLYNEFQGEPRFLILTTAANESVAFIHNRMPVIIYKEMIGRWLGEKDQAKEMLCWQQPELDIVTA